MAWTSPGRPCPYTVPNRRDACFSTRVLRTPAPHPHSSHVSDGKTESGRGYRQAARLGVGGPLSVIKQLKYPICPTPHWPQRVILDPRASPPQPHNASSPDRVWVRVRVSVSVRVRVGVRVRVRVRDRVS